MPIVGITYQPAANSLNAAYRPVILRVKAKIPNSTPTNYIPPVVFCDIYVSGIYYKSLSRSQFIANDGTATEYEFDIQDAVQELMGTNLPKINGDVIEVFNNTIKKISVKFRNTFTDNNGFNTSEQAPPIQGTSSTPPTSGGGIESQEFYVMNSVIQHEENQNFDQLLNSYKTGNWNNNAFPLTKRPEDYKICKKDSSHFPIVSMFKPVKLCVKAKMKDGSIIDLCTDILEDCPIVKNITYTVVNNGNGTQTFTFNWILPGNLNAITGLNIYHSDSSGGWISESGSFNPTRSITLDLGKYDFRFGLIGSCRNQRIDLLPGINNIGLLSIGAPGNNPPEVIIRWTDNLGNEDRICNSPVCNFTIENYATDPDNDIVLNQVFKRTDNNPWTIFIANATQSVFSDSINTIGSQYYKVVVTDSQNNSTESNVLKYSKQQTILPFYQYLMTSISCTANGDGPTNYTVWCVGLEDFKLSDVLNVTGGYFRLKVDGGNNTFGLTKYGGGYLIVDQVLPITQLLTASYGAAGQNPPSAYPWGYQSNEPAVYYQFEYSLDGVTGWTPFQFLLDD